MSVYFVDTSALAKRYLVETGSAWVRGWIEPAHGNVMVIAETTIVEMKSLLHRRQREGSLTALAAVALQNDFLLHAQKQYLRVSFDEHVLNLAGHMVDTYPLRALDAIQLASAIRGATILGDPTTFVSADHNLLQAAAAEGFTIDNPNAHP